VMRGLALATAGMSSAAIPVAAIPAWILNSRPCIVSRG
jgi:hypothetical protein